MGKPNAKQVIAHALGGMTDRGCLAQASDVIRALVAHRFAISPQARIDKAKAKLAAAVQALAAAEAAIARVRYLHGEIPYKPGYCYCSNPCPCPTIRALDAEETSNNG